MDLETNDSAAADDGPVDPLDAFFDQLAPAGVGELWAVAAAFDPADPAHAAAWGEIHAIEATTDGAESEIARIRARVAEWATRGSGLAVGHIGVDVGDDLRRVARTAVADALVDACVAYMLADHLDPATRDVLMRPWGVPDEIESDEAGVGADESDVAVACEPAPGGWTCHVTVGGPGTPTTHEVSVRAADLARLAPKSLDPADLVARSFVFLLAREPKDSIMRGFDLLLIARYFPEYEREIRS